MVWPGRTLGAPALVPRGCAVPWKGPMWKNVLCSDRWTAEPYWSVLLYAEDLITGAQSSWLEVAVWWKWSYLLHYSEQGFCYLEQKLLRGGEEQVITREKKEKASWSLCAAAPEPGEAEVPLAVMKEERMLKGRCATNKWSHSQLTFFL